MLGASILGLVSIAVILMTSQLLHTEKQEGENRFAQQKESYRLATIRYGAIERNFVQDARALGLPYNVIQQAIDGLSQKVNFRRDLQPGDKYVISYQPERGELLAIRLHTRRKQLSVVRYKNPNGGIEYFDQSGNALSAPIADYPLRYSRISSYFSKSRFHPVLRKYMPHNGVDFVAPLGTPISSVSAGRVLVAGYRRGSGYMVKVRHGAGVVSSYLHLQRIEKGIRRGVFVEKGDVIGRLGQSGTTTGPHLHYSISKNGRYVDPLQFTINTQKKIAEPPLQYITEHLRALPQV